MMHNTASHPAAATSDIRLADSWNEFCRTLASAGNVLLRPEAPGTELDQAEGLRYLSRLTRTALNMLVDSSDADFPRIFMLTDDTVKIGADNPDNIYQQVVVKGDREYRLWGTPGTVPYLSIGTKANRYAIDGTMASTGEIEFTDVELEADGSFEIIVSRDKKGRNWLPLAADSTLIIIRQTFDNKATQSAAQIHVECIGGPKYPQLLSRAKIEGALQQTAAWVNGTATTFADWTREFMTRPNEILPRDQAFFQKAGGDPKIWYGHAYFELEPDEAWVIESTVPRCRMWNFQLDNWWMESLDHVNHKIWINNSQAKLEPDGRVVLVAAGRDPGFGNWIDTAGHSRGTALWRWIEADHHPLPKCRVIKL